MEKAQKAVGELPEFAELAAAEEELKEIGYTDMAAYQAKSQEISTKFADVMSAYYEKVQQAIADCIAQFPDAEAAAYMFDVYNNNTPLAEYEAGFNNFSDKVKDSFLAQGAREELACRKATMPGAVAPDFTLNDPEGNPVTLSSLRGQYVIVDFWASWCKPCRAGVPDMKKLYAKYHPKGLEIIGVSDDSDHDAWKKAIEQDQTPWIHVVDEFPVENKPARVGSLWGVHYIPSYFLLDKEGKIIGKMEHEELAAKLAELLD
jgi:peroxiredoxin